MSDEVREAVVLLGNINAWHINQTDAPRALRALREHTVLLTGRTDLAEIPVDDIDLRLKCYEAVDLFLDSLRK
jgi:hypothetical protein